MTTTEEIKTEIKEWIILSIVLIILSLLFGGIVGGFLATKSQNSLLEQAYKKGYNQGYDELRTEWINSFIGLKDSCYYETNQNNTMVRYVCGQLTNGWKAIK